MTRIIFQDIDSYTRIGCFSLVNQLHDGTRARQGEPSDLFHRHRGRIILFRSAFASLQRCSCYLRDNRIAVVTLLRRGAETHGVRDTVTVTASAPLSHFLIKIKIALNKAQHGEINPRCPWCQAASATPRQAIIHHDNPNNDFFHRFIHRAPRITQSGIHYNSLKLLG